MSACLSSGGSAAAAYSFDLEKIKSPPSSSTTTTITRATSPSSTITESSNSPLAISTRKPRTQRKRPNQSYNEAAAVLSTAYPNIFFSPSSTNYLYAKNKTHHFYGFDHDDDAELLLLSESVEEEPDYLFNPMIQAKPEFYSDQKEVSSGVSIDESEVSQFEFSDEFDSVSILDQETEEGIDSIMGKLEPGINRNRRVNRFDHQIMKGFKLAENIPLGLGLRSALREHNDDATRWRFRTVDFEQISPRVQSVTVDDEKTEVKKSKKKVAAVPLTTESSREETEERSGRHPMLKLDYDGILEAWSDKATPFGDEILGSEATGADVNARLAQIDLFGDSGVREASVLRYKEKRQTRLFSKKIRYQVRKLNADQRPRVKGRFVRRPSASTPSCQR